MRAESGHELSDANVPLLMAAGIALLALVAACAGFVFWWIQGLAAIHAPQWETPPDFPAPRLQVSPESDLRALREEEDRRLQGYAWMDREHGVIRIPIERAMELVSKGRKP